MALNADEAEAPKENAFAYFVQKAPFSLIKAYSATDKDLPADREANVLASTAESTTKSNHKVKVCPDDGTRGVEFTLNEVARRFDNALGSLKVEGAEKFKLYEESVLTSAEYRRTWQELTRSLTPDERNKEGMFDKIRKAFYNAICAPEKEIYAGDAMIYYLKHKLKKRTDMTPRVFLTRLTEILDISKGLETKFENYPTDESEQKMLLMQAYPTSYIHRFINDNQKYNDMSMDQITSYFQRIHAAEGESASKPKPPDRKKDKGQEDKKPAASEQGKGTTKKGNKGSRDTERRSDRTTSNIQNQCRACDAPREFRDCYKHNKLHPRYRKPEERRSDRRDNHRRRSRSRSRSRSRERDHGSRKGSKRPESHHVDSRRSRSASRRRSRSRSADRKRRRSRSAESRRGHSSRRSRSRSRSRHDEGYHIDEPECADRFRRRPRSRSRSRSRSPARSSTKRSRTPVRQVRDAPSAKSPKKESVKEDDDDSLFDKDPWEKLPNACCYGAMKQFQRFLINIPEDLVYYLMKDPFNAELRVLRQYKKKADDTRGQEERLYMLNEDKNRIDFLDVCLRVYRKEACTEEHLESFLSRNDIRAQRYKAIHNLKDVVTEHTLRGYELREQHARDVKSNNVLCDMTDVRYPSLPTPGDHGNISPEKFRELFPKPITWPKYPDRGDYLTEPDDYDEAKYYPNI